jgi:hypothetical protein
MKGNATMYDNLRNKNRCIVIATKLDKDGQDLITYSQHLFRNSLIPFRLVHVIEPRFVPGVIAGYPGDFVGSKLSQDYEDTSFSEAVTKLSAIAERVLPERECSHAVIFGRIPSAVVAEAISSKASLIVAAAGQITDKSFPYGYSTSLGLMTGSTLPVMIVPNHVSHVRNYDHLRVLVADDLSDHSRGALSMGCEFANAFSNSELMHLHICKSTREDIKQWGEQILESMTAGRIPMDPSFRKDHYIDKVGQFYRNSLESRIGSAKMMVEQTGKYHSSVLYGEPFEQFEQAVEKFNPDIVIFGRHEFVHARPMGIGRMPFQAMLALNRTLVIAPAPLLRIT